MLVLKMSNLVKFEIVTRKNYVSWIFGAKIYLDAMGLGVAIKEINKTLSN